MQILFLHFLSLFVFFKLFFPSQGYTIFIEEM